MRVKYMTREMARLMRKYPYAQLQEIYIIIEQEWMEKSLINHEQYISPVYYSYVDKE